MRRLTRAMRTLLLGVRMNCLVFLGSVVFYVVWVAVPSNVHVMRPSVLAVPWVNMILLDCVFMKAVTSVWVFLQVLAVLLVNRRVFWRIVVPSALQQ